MRDSEAARQWAEASFKKKALQAREALTSFAMSTHSSFVSSFQFSQRPANAKGARSRLAIA